MVELLRDEGYTVIEAVDGREALDLLDDPVLRDGVCLLILDMNLPGVDGLGVLRYLAERGWAIPVVAMSAERMNLERARRQGAQQLIAKPFAVDRLLETVHRACGAAARERASQRYRSRSRPAPEMQRPSDRASHTVPMATLSAEEWEIVALVAEGLTNQAIADRLGLTRLAVSEHVATIVWRLGLQGRHEIAVRAIEQELHAAPSSSDGR